MSKIQILQQLDEEIKAKRNEIASLLKEKDIISLEVSEQRRAKTEAYTQTIRIQSEFNTFNTLLDATKQELDKAKFDFSTLTEKQIKTIEELNEKITEWLKKLKKNQSKNLIDIDTENIKAKQKISEFSTEIDILEKKKQKLFREIEKEKESIEKEKESIEKEKQQLIEYRTSLEIRENRIEDKERKMKQIQETLWSKIL